ncbi:MAG: RimJ/RimL family protein N-acetyltransferase [Planctomycetota bacterium]|jgi:RimJ/RimL family protein N-acetyltransferase
MKQDLMDAGGYVFGNVRLRAKTPADVASGARLIQEHGALLDGWGAQHASAASQLTEPQLAQLWSPWQRPGPQGTDYQLTIADPETDAFRGSLVIRCTGPGPAADLGYWVDPAFWGQGLGGGAVRLAQWWVFSVLKASGLSASVQPQNSRSIGLLDSLGFECLGAIPGQGEALQAHFLHRFRWADRDGAWSPQAR